MSSPAAARSVAFPVGRSAFAAVGVYVAALVGGEALAAFGTPAAGAGAEVAVLLALLAAHLLGGARVARVYAALALVPLLRLASLALATENRLVSIAAGGLTVLVAVVLAARTLELPGVLALREIRRRSQWQAALAALCLAVPAGSAIGALSLTGSRSVPALALAALVAFVFAGVLEELLFRGIVQGALDPVLGAWSVPVADLLFAAAYLGTRAPAYTAFMAAFGLACGWWVRRTRSIAGAAAAHGALAAGLLVLLPAVS